MEHRDVRGMSQRLLLLGTICPQGAMIGSHLVTEEDSMKQSVQTDELRFFRFSFCKLCISIPGNITPHYSTHFT
jgi:hypothetical protein